MHAGVGPSLALVLLALAAPIRAAQDMRGSGAGGWIAAELAKLTASDPAAGDSFGGSTSVFGATAVIGAIGVDRVPGKRTGAAYVFERDAAGVWSEARKLTASDGEDGDSFGGEVAIWNDTIVVGANSDGQGFPLPDEVRGLDYDPLADVLYGASDADELLLIDPATGGATSVGPFGFTSVQDLAFDPDTGTLYGVDGVTDQLITIDEATGAGVAVGPLGLNGAGGLAFDPDAAKLYATSPSDLLAVDTATGAATAVGPHGVGTMSGLAFDPFADVLYGVSLSQNNLYTLDPETGAATYVGNLGTFVYCLASSSSPGTIYGVDSSSIVQLITIDTATALVTPVPILSMGSAYVFERDAGGPAVWSEVKKLLASDGQAGDIFGTSVAIWGNTVVVGAPWGKSADGKRAGAAYVFERDAGGPGAWGEVAKLSASDGEDTDKFGWSAAVYKDTAVVGALDSDLTGDPEVFSTGAAYVFERDAGGPGGWVEVAKLHAADPGTYDQFGVSVGVLGDTMVVGANNDDHPGDPNDPYVGSAHVFERDPEGGQWSQTAKLIASDGSENDTFGSSVALGANAVVVGANNDDAGSAYVFVRNQGGAGAWGEAVKLIPGDGASGDWFGSSVALVDHEVLVGASRDDHAGGNGAGSAYVFAFSFPGEAYCTPGTSASGCQAAISATGTASATASSGFLVMASNVEGSKDGLFYFGVNGKQANPWGNGTSFQCVVPPVTRVALLAGVGTNGSCDGSFAEDFNALWCSTCPKPSKNPGPGVFVQTQLWYRDPQSTSNQTTGLSDAIEFYVGP